MVLIYEISVHPSYKEIIKEFIRRKPPGRNMHVKGKRAISQVIYKKNGRAEALPFNNPIRQKRSACGLADAYIQRKCFMRYRAKKMAELRLCHVIPSTSSADSVALE